jgi:murein DD-endopeptidase MepM/ murein hydrolase activator NlpD
MPVSVSVLLTNPKKSKKNYTITYTDPEDKANLETGWLAYDMTQNTPDKYQPWRIWYRQVSAQRQIEVTYHMPSNNYFIPGRYRIDCFVPDQHATVRDASFAVTRAIDGQGHAVEETINLDFWPVNNEWVPLGEFNFDIGRSPEIGKVRQFDDSSKNLTIGNIKKREVSFGPIRWVPLYQTPEPIYVGVDDPLNCAIDYYDATKADLLAQQWSHDVNPDFLETKKSWKILRRRRSTTRQLQVDYNLPISAPNGRYRIEVFIPDFRGKKSTQAQYIVKTRMRMVSGKKKYTEKPFTVNQSQFNNQWVPLGEYNLKVDTNPDPGRGSLVGQVSQFDGSNDLQNIAITFGPVRWVPRFALKFKKSQQFDFPIGNETERAAPIVIDPQRKHFWLKDWFDASPYAEDYPLGLHTGADLNESDADDRDAPIYAAGDGTVIFAKLVPNTSWGNVIVIEHLLAKVRLPDGRIERRTVFTRYGHVSPKSLELVQKDKIVMRGQQIGFIGLAGGSKDGWHLHFDVSPTEQLKNNPDHWPKMDDLRKLINDNKQHTKEYRSAKARALVLIRQDYIDPLQFIIDNHAKK